MASDTASGIHRWWLQSDPRWDIGTVTRALGQLVEAGLLDELPALDGRVRYRLKSSFNSE